MPALFSLPRATAVWSVALALTLSACRSDPPARRFELKGQVLSVKTAEGELLVKHEDIKGFMPAMTMPYKVQPPEAVAKTAAGDLITATLVIEPNGTAYLSALTKTGAAPIENPDAGPEISVYDILEPGEPVPDALLVDESGKPRPLSSYKGKRLVLTFIYTRCPDAEFCPLMSQQFAALQKSIKSTPALADVQLLSISFDPEFDTPTVLKEHAAAQRADPLIWHFATGTKEEITKLANVFGVSVSRDGSPILIHNLGTAVIDATGRLVKLHSTNQWTPSDVVAELQTTPAATH